MPPATIDSSQNSWIALRKWKSEIVCTVHRRERVAGLHRWRPPSRGTMFFHKAPLAFIIFFLVAAVLFFCFLAYFYLWMCCRKRYRLKEQQRKSSSSEKKTNEERFHDLAKPENNKSDEQAGEEGKSSRKFYPIVFHNKTQETAELRLL